MYTCTLPCTYYVYVLYVLLRSIVCDCMKVVARNVYGIEISDLCFRLEVLPHVFCSSMNWIQLRNIEEETLVMAVRVNILYTIEIIIPLQLTILRNIKQNISGFWAFAR